jgi:hypothetical protein
VIIHPDTEIISSTEVTYTPGWTSQPEVEIVSSAEVVYTAPASSGGQPQVIIVSSATVLHTAPLIYADTEGTLELELILSASTEVDTEPVPIPAHFVFEDIRRVSVKMPHPTIFDAFGRPQ